LKPQENRSNCHCIIWIEVLSHVSDEGKGNEAEGFEVLGRSAPVRWDGI